MILDRKQPLGRKETDRGLTWRWPGGKCLHVSALGLQWSGGSQGIRWNRFLFRVLDNCVEWQAWMVNLKECILWASRIEKSEHFVWGEGKWLSSLWFLGKWSSKTKDLVDFHIVLWRWLCLSSSSKKGDENGCTAGPQMRLPCWGPWLLQRSHLY